MFSVLGYNKKKLEVKSYLRRFGEYFVVVVFVLLLPSWRSELLLGFVFLYDDTTLPVPSFSFEYLKSFVINPWMANILNCPTNKEPGGH